MPDQLLVPVGEEHTGLELSVPPAAAYGLQHSLQAGKHHLVGLGIWRYCSRTVAIKHGAHHPAASRLMRSWDGMSLHTAAAGLQGGMAAECTLIRPS